MKLILTLFIVCFYLVGRPQNAFEVKSVNKNSLKYAELIAKGSMVQNDAVGIGGIKPKQAYYFDSLMIYSSEAELIELTNHSDEKVRCYSFQGLVQVSSSKLVEVLQKNENDTDMVFSQSGCIVTSQSVISWMFYNISATELSKMKNDDLLYIEELRGKL